MAHSRRRRPHAAPGARWYFIDEIDKAPRDFPNDLLNEVEHRYFATACFGATPRSTRTCGRCPGR
ncbi:MAG: hypothetical protein R3F60_14665 [bacterium]